MRRILLLALSFAACRATTTRPPISPRPTPLVAELRFDVPGGTRFLAQAFEVDSIPVLRVEPDDGFLESPWFTLADRKPTTTRPSGPEMLKVRGWVDPARPGYVRFIVEVAYRPWVDPSRPGRDLERQVPPDHRVSRQVGARLLRLLEIYGEPTAADSARLEGTP